MKTSLTAGSADILIADILLQVRGVDDLALGVPAALLGGEGQRVGVSARAAGVVAAGRAAVGDGVGPGRVVVRDAVEGHFHVAGHGARGGEAGQERDECSGVHCDELWSGKEVVKRRGPVK